MIKNENQSVKHIGNIIGEWGKWQRHLFCFCFILGSVSALNNMGYTFHAYNNEFWCSDVPFEYPNKTSHMKCFKFENPNETCTEWQYVRDEISESINTEFDLVCGRTNLASMSQSFFMLGYIVSGLVFSYYSDKYGRKPVVWISFTFELLGIISCALSLNITQYIISRFFVGMGNSGRGVAIDTLLMECSGPKYRSDIAIYTDIGWVLGYVVIPLLAYWLQSFRYMQLFSFVFMTLMMVWFYFIDESPRWQLTNGQTDRAEITLRKALKLNGKSDTNLNQQLMQLSEHLQSHKKSKKVYSILDLFKTTNLRKYTLIFWYSSIVNTLIYYGISFNMADFGGNFYVTFMLSGLVELPSTLLSAIGIRFGRKKIYTSFMLTITLSTIAVILSKGESALTIIFVLIGKFAVSSSWCVLGIHAPEVYPTVVRHIGIGSNSVVGRIGSVSAPFMKNLAANTSLTFVMTFYAILSAIGALLNQYLPETKGRELPDTIEETENLKSMGVKSAKLKVIKGTAEEAEELRSIE